MRTLKLLFLGLGFILLISLLLSGCRSQPPAQPAVDDQSANTKAPASTPGPRVTVAAPEGEVEEESQEAGAMPEDTPLTEEELVQRVLDAVQMLDDTPFQYKSEIAAFDELQIFENGETMSREWNAVFRDSGARFQHGGSLQMRLRREASFPNIPDMFPMQVEARLIDGQIYLKAGYTEADPELPQIQERYLFAVPEGWINVYGASSLAFWPSFRALSVEDLDRSLSGDASELLMSHDRETIGKSITTHLASATYERDTDEQGQPLLAITLFLKPAALAESLTSREAADPLIPLLVDALEGTPVIHKMLLDEAGHPLAWDRVVRLEVNDLDLSPVPGFETGATLNFSGSRRWSVKLSYPAKIDETVSAPDMADRVKDKKFLGGGPSTKPPFHSLDEFDRQLNAALETGSVDEFWSEVLALGQMPLIFDDLAVFLYLGEAGQVDWVGDWTTPNGVRLGGSDLWLHAAALPQDARLEYEIRLDGEKLLTDPLNPLTETGGLGTKSVVLMPEYVPPQFTETLEGIPQGALSEDIALASASLGYDVNYRVYTPAGYEKLSRLPVIYVTDGQDYLEFGRMATVLDNLIAAGEIRPLIAVFIDPRDTETGENLRNEQFFDNPKYGDFIAQELVPAVDKAYRTDRSPQARAILGASNGGYHSAYFARQHSDLIGLIGMMSPNLEYNPALLSEYEQGERLPVKVFLSTGRWHDFLDSSRRMRELLEAKDYSLLYIETDEGHSYGNWRSKLDDLLVYFFGT
jgi:enterochelin esterase family protein